MTPPFFATALRLASENRRLRHDCEQLLTALHLARDDANRARMDLQRVAHERDVALGVVVGLRTDVGALEAQVALLMEATPSDLREMEA